MTEPTKTVTHEYFPGGEKETTSEALCSVEIGATAKGDVQIKSVKVYAADPNDAADQALATFRRIQDALAIDAAEHEREVHPGKINVSTPWREATISGERDELGQAMAAEAIMGREWAKEDAVENS